MVNSNSVTVRNIIVGAANLWTADVTDGSGGKIPLPTLTPSQSAYDDFDGAAAWDVLGATQEGVEVGYEPDYGEIEVDQLKDAAKLFNQGVTVTVSTNLAEATLVNLALAWNLESDAVSGDVLSIAVPDDTPFEKQLAFIGSAPDATDETPRERVYHCRRVISVDGSTHALRRTEATVFPVSFRLLADPTYDGSQYGTITDRDIA